MKKIEILFLPNGKSPYKQWLSKLPGHIRGQIHKYIKRLSLEGSKKNIKHLGEGVFELKIYFGPGFRVYFGELNNKVILLILGGDKSTQQRDILKAKNYWRNYYV